MEPILFAGLAVLAVGIAMAMLVLYRLDSDSESSSRKHPENTISSSDATGVQDELCPEQTTRIFISHSYDDHQIVRGLVRTFEAFFELQEKTILCTSLPGYDIRAGEYIPDTLRARVSGADVLVAVITPQSLRSTWVMFELGAAWGSGVWVAPVLVGKAGSEDLPGPLRQTIALRLSDRAKTAQLMEDVGERLGLSRRGLARSVDELDELIELAQQQEQTQ